VNKVGWTAAAYGATSFVLPFAFVFGPALLLQASLAENAIAVVTSFAGILAIAIAVIGAFKTPLSPALRIISAIAGLALLFQGFISAGIGAVLLIGLYLYERNRAATLNSEA
jgi:TRAP-type uncharacterized transport system fused permease subunit